MRRCTRTSPRATGIKINRVDADDAGILARLKTEGSASPADVILLVDAARLWRAEVDGLFQPVRSKTLQDRIPAQLRGKDDGQGSQWFGFSTRARVVVYNKTTVKRDDVDTYEELADPKNKGRLCTRSGSHPYNLSLFGAMYEHLGPKATETWLSGSGGKYGTTAQRRRHRPDPCRGERRMWRGTDQYLLRRPADAVSEPRRQGARWRKWRSCFRTRPASALTSILPAPPSRDMPRTRTPRSAFSNTWPAMRHKLISPMATTSGRLSKGVKLDNPALQALGDFKGETIPVSIIGMNQVKIQQMLDRVGYK